MIREVTPLVCGYTCQDHLLVDLDACSLWQAARIAIITRQEYPQVGDCLIVQSSEHHYHLIFDAKLEWEKIHDIVMTMGALGIVEKNFSMVRELRHDLTLRISPKKYRDHTSQTPLPIMLIGENEPENSYGITKYLRGLEAFMNTTEDANCQDR